MGTKAEAAQRRLEAMLPAAGDVIEAFLEKEHRVKVKLKCAGCEAVIEQWTNVKLPGRDALKTALEVHKQVLGTKREVLHKKPQMLPGSSVQQLQALSQELLALPYMERKALAMSILPEHAPPPPALLPEPSSTDGSSPEVDSS
jgi:hypothetical protein